MPSQAPDSVPSLSFSDGCLVLRGRQRNSIQSQFSLIYPLRKTLDKFSGRLEKADMQENISCPAAFLRDSALVQSAETWSRPFILCCKSDTHCDAWFSDHACSKQPVIWGLVLEWSWNGESICCVIQVNMDGGGGGTTQLRFAANATWPISKHGLLYISFGCFCHSERLPMQTWSGNR